MCVGRGTNQAVSEVTTPSQPLTRADCDKAGMTWKDNANVSPQSQKLPTLRAHHPDPVLQPTIQLAIVINIDKARQRMRVLLNGAEKYEWPVSTGRPSYFTPSGSYTATSMNEVWYSKEWDDAPMPHSIFFTKDGHAIHGSYEVKKDSASPYRMAACASGPKMPLPFIRWWQRTASKTPRSFRPDLLPAGRERSRVQHVLDQPRRRPFRAR